MSDTIAAIATALSPSAIGILRLSGPDTKAVLDAVFFPLNGKPMSQQTPRTMVLGRVLDGEGRVLDSALCVLFPGPDSYTGEDCAELHCHGSPVVLTEGLKLLLNHGARQAKGGEFTQRAFLNGRMDLMQAEAVVDVIDAETAQAARNAAGQLDGALSRTVQAVYDTLMDVTSRFYAIVDYPDEDIEDLNRTQLLDALGRSEASLAALCEAIGALYPTGAEPQGELLTNARQADAVRRALSCVKNAHASLQFGMTPDVVLTDAEGALEALGELSGKHIREDLVDTIFSRFCVGK